MFKPKFSILLRPDRDGCTCLGSQLIDIVDVVKAELEAHLWYASDVDAFSSVPSELGLDTWFLRRIGDDAALCNFCSRIEQFIWGVFIAIRDIDCREERIERTQLSAEDEEFRPIDLEGVLLEIRAFDSSLFEVVSDNENLINRLGLRFGVEPAGRNASNGFGSHGFEA